MHVSVPFIFGPQAPLADLGEVGQLIDAQRSGFEVPNPQHELFIQNDNLSSGRGTFKITRGTVAIVSLLACVAGVALLVFQCFRALTSGRSKKNQGVTARRVAEGGREVCSVSHHVERAAHTAASQSWPVPAAVSGRCRLNLPCFRHASHDLFLISEQTTCPFTNAGRLYSRRYIAAQQRTTPNTFTSGLHAWRS